MKIIKIMSTRSGRIRQSLIETSPSRTRKGISPTRSPARNRKSSPTTRSAQKSPSRKSPSRKSASKYPARKSPSRAVKELKEEKEISVPKSPVKRPALKKDTEFKVVDVSSKIEISRSTRSRRFDYSIKDLPQPVAKVEPLIDEKPNGLDTVHSITDVYGLRNRKNFEDLVPRRSSRLKDVVDNFSDIRRSVSKSLSKSISKSVSHSIDTYSDEENSEELLPKERSQPITRKLSTPLPSSVSLAYLSNRYEFGGKLGSIILSILIPFFVFALLISCSKSCSHTSFLDQSLYKSVSKWFSVTTSLVVISQFFLQAIFVSLPIFGTKEVNEQGKRYYFNGFFSSFCTISLLFALDYYKVFNVDSVLTSYLSMATFSYMVAVTLAIILFIKSSQVSKDSFNPYGNSGFLLYDFFMGRQITNNTLRINVKLYLSRVSNISTVSNLYRIKIAISLQYLVLMLYILINTSSFSLYLQY